MIRKTEAISTDDGRRAVMPGINIKLSGTEFPRTTVEAAIMRGRWKVQEARRLREEQAARSEETTPTTTGMEQGDMLDPFNITAALRMMDWRDEKEDKDGHDAADAKKPVGDMLKAEQKDKIPAGREKKENVAEDRGMQEIRIDEQGAVIEEKETERPARERPVKENAFKRIVRTVIGNVPAQPVMLEQEKGKEPRYRSSTAGTDARESANVRRTDRSPEELRLNSRAVAHTEEHAARFSKSSHEERSSDRLEGRIRKEQTVRFMQQASETAYKLTEHMPVEGHNLPGRAREDTARTEMPFIRGASGLAVVTMPAEDPAKGREDGRHIKEEAKREPLQKQEERIEEPHMREAASGREAMNGIIENARENAAAGNLVMQAAAVTHATGREIQFEKGRDLLQIRREGNETFAYINGEKADIGKARDFMKDLSRSIGPELTEQMKSMVNTLSQNPGLSIRQAAEAGKQPAQQMQAKSSGMITRD